MLRCKDRDLTLYGLRQDQRRGGQLRLHSAPCRMACYGARVGSHRCPILHSMRINHHTCIYTIEKEETKWTTKKEKMSTLSVYLICSYGSG